MGYFCQVAQDGHRVRAAPLSEEGLRLEPGQFVWIGLVDPTDEEFDIIKQHPVWGVELLAGIEFPWDLKPIIQWHHEKYDGTGYPHQLKGDAIPLSAQIIGIVDVYDALTRNGKAIYRELEARYGFRNG